MAASFAAVSVRAQQPSPGSPETEAPYTLHVYQNLVQVTTLVLNQHLLPETGLRVSDFQMQIDAGPKFAPLSYRVEGRDPLSVAIVLDASSAVEPEQLTHLVESLAPSAPRLFTADDRLTFYAIDCALVRTRELGVEATSDSVRKALVGVLENTSLHGPFYPLTGCEGSRKLWDAVGVAVRQIGQAPGRRVVLVLTDGVDRSSVDTWHQLREFADGLSVSIFGIRPHATSPATFRDPRGGSLRSAPEDIFDLLCGGTGGIVLTPPDGDLTAGFAQAMQLIRERYVLEFQRPRNSTAGRHVIEVKVPDRKAIVRPGGVMVEMPNASVAHDPSTVPVDDSRAPTIGTRRPLSATPQ